MSQVAEIREVPDTRDTLQTAESARAVSQMVNRILGPICASYVQLPR